MTSVMNVKDVLKKKEGQNISSGYSIDVCIYTLIYRKDFRNTQGQPTGHLHTLVKTRHYSKSFLIYKWFNVIDCISAWPKKYIVVGALIT